MPAVPSSVQPGRAFGKYVVKRLVAEGGMAVVFEAQHSKLGQRVAIKLLNANLAQKPDIVARFHREAQAAARIPSQHVVRVIDVETTEDGRPYIVMEYLEGRDLEDEIRARGPLPVGDAVAFLLEAASAVSIAHRAGIVHRDIKPANIFVAEEKPRKVVKVLDFGISKVDSPTEISTTSTQTMLGTPLYMSPEQVRSARDVDGRTDIWSLGVVLYEMLTGQLPFYAEEASAVIAAIVSDPFVPVRQIRPDIPQALEDIVMKALQKDRNQRFRLVDDLSNALLPFAPPWFRQPVPSSDRVPSPALPAHLSASLADSLEDEHTVADPDAAPDALKAAPQFPDTAPAFVPQQPQYLAPEPSQPNAVTRTTAGGDKKRRIVEHALRARGRARRGARLRGRRGEAPPRPKRSGAARASSRGDRHVRPHLGRRRVRAPHRRRRAPRHALHGLRRHARRAHRALHDRERRAQRKDRARLARPDRDRAVRALRLRGGAANAVSAPSGHNVLATSQSTPQVPARPRMSTLPLIDVNCVPDQPGSGERPVSSFSL